MTHLRKQIKNIDEVYKQVGEIAIHNLLHSDEKKTLTTDHLVDPWHHAFVSKLYEFFIMYGFIANPNNQNVLFRLPTEPNAYGSCYNADKFMLKVKKFIEPEVINEAESLIRRQAQRKFEE